MSFSAFSKKMGGTTSTSVRTQTITKKQQKLKALSAGLLAAYFTKSVHWLPAWVAGVGVDTTVGKILRKPGKYRYTTVSSTIKIRNGALKGNAYERTFIVPTHLKVEKYSSSKKRYVTLYNSNYPHYELITN